MYFEVGFVAWAGQNRESTCNQARGRRSIIANYKMNSQLSLYQLITTSARIVLINQNGKKSKSEWIHMRRSFAKKLLKTRSFSCQPGLLGRANQPSGHEGLWEFSDCEIEKFCNRLKISVWLNSSINIGTVKAATTAPVVLYVTRFIFRSLLDWCQHCLFEHWISSRADQLGW